MYWDKVCFEDSQLNFRLYLTDVLHSLRPRTCMYILCLSQLP